MPEGWDDFAIDGQATDARIPADTGPLHVDFSVNEPIPAGPIPITTSIFSLLVPGGWVIGKEQDELTQQGVATFLLITLCILALLGFGTYFVWTFKRNRSGYRGTLRKVARGEFANSKKVE